MFDALNILAAIVTLLLGCIGLCFPERAAGIVKLQAIADEGRSEFRASFGGLWFGLGTLPLVTMEPLHFAMAGTVWLTTAIGRIISFMADRTMTKLNIFNVGFELACAIFLLAGAPAAALNASI